MYKKAEEREENYPAKTKSVRLLDERIVGETNYKLLEMIRIKRQNPDVVYDKKKRKKEAVNELEEVVEIERILS